MLVSLVLVSVQDGGSRIGFLILGPSYCLHHNIKHREDSMEKNKSR